MSAPSSNFYITGGTLGRDARCYVERHADAELVSALRAGEFCYVLTSRQMGKSSLMVRAAARLRDRGTEVVVLDLTAIGLNLSPEQWYDGLAIRMGRALGLENELEAFWARSARLGACQRLFAALGDLFLPKVLAEPPAREVGVRLAIFIDELDVVRGLPFSADEFFAAIRECYNRRVLDPRWNSVTFCLLGVATPSDLVRDTRLTPFNIGRRIELEDFTAAEAQSLFKTPTPAKSWRHSTPTSTPSLPPPFLPTAGGWPPEEAMGWRASTTRFD